MRLRYGCKNDIFKFDEKVLGTNVIVSEHFVDRLLERSRDQNHVLNIIKDIVLKMKNELCVLIFESALNNRETRFRVYNGLCVS